MQSSVPGVHSLHPSPVCFVDIIWARVELVIRYRESGATGAWGRNTEEDHATNAVLLETDLGLDDRNTVFARIEAAEKTGEDLVIPELAEEIVGVSKLHIGYRRRLLGGMFEPHVGAALSFSGIPNRVEQAYGRESGFGVTVFLSLRPSAMPGMPGMRRTATSTPSPGSTGAEAVATTPAAVGTTGTAESHAGHTSQYQGKTYYFCSKGCKAKFDANPAQYAK